MERINQRVEESLRQLVKDIVDGKYDQIEADGRIGRLTQYELRRAVIEYGRTLKELPENAFEFADVFELDQPGQTVVDFPLWAEEEGRSDLTLSVTVLDGQSGVVVLIDDCHVL